MGVFGSRRYASWTYPSRGDGVGDDRDDWFVRVLLRKMNSTLQSRRRHQAQEPPRAAKHRSVTLLQSLL